MEWSNDLPYNDLPPLPPPGVDLEPKPVLKAAVEARSALAKLDQAAQLLPNPNILIHIVPLLEAQASSEIENIVTTADELFRHVDTRDNASPAVKEALRYRTALFAGVDAIRERPLTASTALHVCSQLHNHDVDVRAVPGTRIANPTTREVIYSPPEGAHVIRQKLSEWEHFIHAKDDLDPLVRMALAHYQFEAIHPFHDGNGRTGRVLNILMLIEHGLLHAPVLYLSRAIIRRKNDYYRLLRSVTEHGAWNEWTMYMLEVVRDSAEGTMRTITAVRQHHESLADRARESTSGGKDAQFVDLLVEQPYCRITNVAERCSVARQTASQWLHRLADDGILTHHKAGRESLFINHELLAILMTPDAENVS